MVDSFKRNITDLYNLVKNQNTIIEKQIKNTRELYSTDNQNINYKIQQIDYLHGMNVLLFYIYFMLMFILIICIVINPNGNLYIQIGLIITLIIYPFVIYFLEWKLYLLFLYIYSILNGNPYLII
jgi:hypothetical protein